MKTLKIEAADSSEKFLSTYWTTLRPFPEDHVYYWVRFVLDIKPPAEFVQTARFTLESEK
jgi:hypothetical protein